MEKSYHVFRRSNGRWSIRKTGAARASGTYGTRVEAMKHGRILAKAASGQLFVHNLNGTIREARSYGATLHLTSR